MPSPTCPEIREKFLRAREAKVKFDLTLLRLPSVGSPRVLAIHELPVREAKELRTQLKSSLSSLEDLLLTFHETFEGNPIEINLKQEFAESKQFYNSHGLSKFSETLGEKIRLSPEARKRIKEALRQGFDRVMVCVPHEQQTASLDELINKMAMPEVEGLPKEDQYTTPYIDTSANAATIQNRPSGSPYLLFYSSKPIPEDLKDRTVPDLDKFFKERGWNGLTLPEYLLLQRKECEKRGDHSWDTVSFDKVPPSNSTWLLDSRSPSRIVIADWNPTPRRVGVYCLTSTDRLPSLGVRSAAVVEL